jgi:hypothetical protein
MDRFSPFAQLPIEDEMAERATMSGIDPTSTMMDDPALDPMIPEGGMGPIPGPQDMPMRKKKPKKPDPAARRMKALDYYGVLFDVQPPEESEELPPPIGYRFPDPEFEPDPTTLGPPMLAGGPPPFTPPMGAGPNQTDFNYVGVSQGVGSMDPPGVTPYQEHVRRMANKLYGMG